MSKVASLSLATLVSWFHAPLAPVGHATAPAPALASSDVALAAAVEQRLLGDRTGACVAAAVIDTTVSRAFVCASRAQARVIDGKTTFEIGSVSKTMTAFLLADLIDRGKLSLDDTLSAHLPKGTKVPTFHEAVIRLKHLVTHTSGLPALPARMTVKDQNNPYAALTEDALLQSLGDVTLMEAPGTRWAYSNFAFMLVSYVVSHTAHQDLESLLSERLFRPLGMDRAYVAKPKGVRAASGHLSTGEGTSAWDMPVNLAGVGGVRASLDDMIRYAQAQLGRRIDQGGGRAADPATIARLVDLMAKTRQPVATDELNGPNKGPKHRPRSGPTMGMAWILAPFGDHTLVVHEGATGGFWSFVAIDGGQSPGRGRAVVILSDTALHGVGGLGDLGYHLLDAARPPGKPRKRIQPPAPLVQALDGRYLLEGRLGLTLTARGGALFGKADGQSEFELAFDTNGDFYPLSFDALLIPMSGAGGGKTFTWMQSGGSVSARRVSATGHSGKPEPTTPVRGAADVGDYVGEYQLAPDFALRVTAEADQLFIQGTGQARLHADAADKDVFVVESVGAELTFERGDKNGVVNRVILRQHGQVLQGKRKE